VPIGIESEIFSKYGGLNEESENEKNELWSEGNRACPLFMEKLPYPFVSLFKENEDQFCPN